MRHKILAVTDEQVECAACGWVRKTIKDGRPKCSVARRQHRGALSNYRPSRREQLHTQLRGSECDVCGATEGLATDHDHACCPGKFGCEGCIRGTLCRACNVTEPHFRRLVEAGKLDRMVEYLSR